MSEGQFNPQSHDAMFALILERMHAQEIKVDGRHKENQAKLEAILQQTQATNGRVTKLELWRTSQRGWIAGASFVASCIGAGIVKFVLH